MEEIKNFNKNINKKIKGIIKYTNLNRAIIIFLVILFIFQIILFFDNKVYVLPENVSTIIKIVIFSTLAFFISSIIVRFTTDILISFLGQDVEIEFVLFIQKMYSFIIYFIAFSIVLLRLGFSINNLSVILGLATTGFAFAIREIILSYIIWFMLLTKKPFRIGDFIKIGEEEGKVMHIGTFYVILDNTPDRKDDFIRVPNKIFLEKPIINYGNGEVMDKVEIYLQKIPKNFEEIAKKIEIEFLNNNAKVNLNSNKEGIFLVISFKA
ncbi:MAG: mechanosensitive ion channel, partial [Candidatus Woesearchaeota archaeon]